jgi:hypothetical protein
MGIANIVADGFGMGIGDYFSSLSEVFGILKLRSNTLKMREKEKNGKLKIIQKVKKKKCKNFISLKYVLIVSICFIHSELIKSRFKIII